MSDSVSGPQSFESQTLRGIAGSPGVAIGPAVVLGTSGTRFKKSKIADRDIESEVERFRAAVKLAKSGLRGLVERTSRLGTELTILEAYTLMVGDPILADEAERRIRGGRECAEWAVSDAVQELSSQVMVADDAYIRERAHDFNFVGDIIIRALMGEDNAQPLAKLDRPSVVVAHNLSPTDVAAMARQAVMGIVTGGGTRTSHVAIMARALEIPAILGVPDALERINSGDELIVDGARGELIVWPSEREIADAREREEQHLSRHRRLRDTRHRPASTACGVPIVLRANIELPGEALLAKDHGAVGIGLYRTEFMCVGRSTPPSEDEQYEVFRTVVQLMSPHPVTLRTFDMGGDKRVLDCAVDSERNPALGLRAVRLALAAPEVFLRQLCAMVRASAHGPAQILVPMIATLGEFRKVKALLVRAIEDVDRRGLGRAPVVPLGVMVEVPSVALLADRFAGEADFLSLGTNDLVQYTLAADRTSRSLAYLASPFDPAVIGFIDNVVRAVRRHGRPLSVCGEMASEPLGAILLVGMGLRELSMEASAVPEIKEVLSRVTLAEAQQAARRALRLDTAEAVEADLARAFEQRLSDVPETPG